MMDMFVFRVPHIFLHLFSIHQPGIHPPSIHQFGVTLLAVLLGLTLPAQLYAQSPSPQSFIPTFLPLVAGSSSGFDGLDAGSEVQSTNSDIIPGLAQIQGIVGVDVNGQLIVDDPWDHRHRVVGEAIVWNGRLSSYDGQFVIVTGRWQNDAAGSVFIAKNVQQVAVDDVERYASYVYREMSDPMLRQHLAQNDNEIPPSTWGRLGGGTDNTTPPPTWGRPGGGTDNTTPPLTWRQVDGEQAVQAAAIDANPAEQGEWSAVQDIGMYALHAVLRPDGQVMFWYRTAATNALDPLFNTVLWDPITKEVTSVSNESLSQDENWCAAHSQLGDGRLFAVTGNVGTADPHGNILDYTDNHWTSIPDMAYGRYYPSTTFMADGRVVVAGGDYINPTTGVVDNPFPEVWHDGAWRTFDEPLTIAPTPIEFNFYYGSFFPWTQQAPNGKIFYAGPQSDLRYMDPGELNATSGGSVTSVATRDSHSRDYGGYATYDIGKVLIAGGGDSLSSAYTIDYNLLESANDTGNDTPAVSQSGYLNIGRRNFYTTILADGTVLATGGNKDGGITQASADGAVFMAELWDPATGDWTAMASMGRRREYHSVAILLPDARVVHAGGDCTPCDPQTNLEVFSPPYLFNADGSEASRPQIIQAPEDIDYGELFAVESPQAIDIAKINLIRLGSATHATNFDQRLVPLNYAQAGRTLTVTGPKNGYIAPPGFYMLFLVDSAGVPSVAKIIKVGTHVERVRSLYGVTNSGFEGATQAAENNIVYYQAGDSIGGWIVEAGNVDVHHNTYLNAGIGAEGDQHLDLHGIDAGQISQAVTGLTPGQRYTLEFDYRSHPLTLWAAATVEINDEEYYWLAEGSSATEWNSIRIEFTPTVTSTVVRFKGHDELTYAGMLLDHIVIDEYKDDQPAPETGRSPINLANGQTASQSSLFAGGPQKVVDGNTNGSSQGNEVTRSTTEIQPWWQVDLGTSQAIDTVVIWPQSDCCADPLHNFYILYADSDLTGRELDEILNDVTVQRVYMAEPVEEPLALIQRGSGRYVRIQSAIRSSLSLAEVQVFSPPPPNRPPVFSGPTEHLVQLGDASSSAYTAVDPDGHALSFVADGLPEGLGIDPATGIISGTVPIAGSYAISITAADNYGGSDLFALTWIVNQSPSIVNPGPQSPTAGDEVLIPIAVADDDGDSLTYAVDGLPTGLMIIEGEAIITSTASVSMPLLISGTVEITGTQQTTITIMDERGGSASTTFEWSINSPPSFGAVSNQVINPGVQTYILASATDADNNILTYSGTGLPPGLEVMAPFGIITGTTIASGGYTVTMIADDGNGGVGSAQFGLTVNTPPTINNPGEQNDFVGDDVNLVLNGGDVDGHSLAYNAFDLPPGLVFSAENRTISGQLAHAGLYTVTATIKDEFDLSTGVGFVWQVEERINQPPMLLNPGAQINTLGDTVALAIVASDPEKRPLTYSGLGLPAGLSIDVDSGQISGTLSLVGTYTVTVAVDDGQDGAVAIDFLWIINEPPNAPPIVQNPAAASAGGTVSATLGSAVSLQLSASDPDDDALTFSAEGLPPGLVLNAATGVISGVPLVAGTYAITVKVDDLRGLFSITTFVWSIEAQQVQPVPTIPVVDPDPVVPTPTPDAPVSTPDNPPDGENESPYQLYLPLLAD